MDKNIHDTDDFFKDAYRQFEEEPSGDVWEKINAGLDRKKTDGKTKKIIAWKRAGIFLLCLFIGIIFFYSGIFKTGSHSGNNVVTQNGAKKSHSHEIPAKKVEINNDEMSSAKKETAQDEKKETENMGIKKFNDKNITGNPTSIKKQFAIPANAVLFNENTKSSYKKNESPQPEKITAIPLSKNNNTGSLFTRLLNSIGHISLVAINEFVLKTSNIKITKPQKKNSFTSYWLLAAFASFERVNYNLNSDLPGNISGIKHREVHEPSYSGGILATRHLTKHWGLQTGLIYSNTAIGITPQKLYALQDAGGNVAFKYATSSGYAYIKPGLGAPPVIGDSLSTTEGKHTLQFISIPAMVKYSMKKNKFTLAPGAGIEANFVTSAKVETEIEHPSQSEIVFINKLKGAKSFYLSIVADVELRYQLSKKLSASLRPSLRYAISPITKNNVVETFPYSFGTGAGVSLRF